MEIFQCPECQLRFRFPSELDDHMGRDHPEFHCGPRSLEDALLGATHRHRHSTPAYPPNHKAEPPPEPASPSAG